MLKELSLNGAKMPNGRELAAPPEFEHFGHSLGHGIGLAVHEGPKLSYVSDNEISSGVVVTAEPGIYIPGWGGVRIEDVILINGDEVEVLSSAPKEAVLTR